MLDEVLEMEIEESLEEGCKNKGTILNEDDEIELDDILDGESDNEEDSNDEEYDELAEYDDEE
jgi:hypothetical protein